MASKTVDPAVLKRAATRSAQASTRLERRAVPPGYVRPARVEEVLEVRRKRSR